MKTKHGLFFFGAVMVIAAIFSFSLLGCNIDTTTDAGYTFKFKVDNYFSSPITKIEFINGNNQNDKSVGTGTLNLSYGNRSSEYKVSGFTVERGDGRVFGVKVTFGNGNTAFNSSYAGHESKILVTVSSYGTISFSTGNW